MIKNKTVMIKGICSSLPHWMYGQERDTVCLRKVEAKTIFFNHCYVIALFTTKWQHYNKK